MCAYETYFTHMCRYLDELYVQVPWWAICVGTLMSYMCRYLDGAALWWAVCTGTLMSYMRRYLEGAPLWWAVCTGTLMSYMCRYLDGAAPWWAVCTGTLMSYMCRYLDELLPRSMSCAEFQQFTTTIQSRAKENLCTAATLFGGVKGGLNKSFPQQHNSKCSHCTMWQ
jgi:adenosylmethionine-8-amino-7-oxononanoate aminotransferase